VNCSISSQPIPTCSSAFELLESRQDSARVRQRTDQPWAETDQPWAEPSPERVINGRFSPIIADKDSGISPQRRRGRREYCFFVCRETTTNKNISPLGTTAPVKTLREELTADSRRLSQLLVFMPFGHVSANLAKKLSARICVVRPQARNPNKHLFKCSNGGATMRAPIVITISPIPVNS